MTPAITATYAVALVPVWFALWLMVTKLRADRHISIGDGGMPDLHARIRRHGNFIEWVPFVLILMILAEAVGAPAPWLHAAGALLVAGRLAHPFGLKSDNGAHPLRFVGNGTNLLAVLILTIAIVRLAIIA